MTHVKNTTVILGVVIEIGSDSFDMNRTGGRNETENVGDSPTRHIFLARSSKRREVFGEPQGG